MFPTTRVAQRIGELTIHSALKLDWKPGSILNTLEKELQHKTDEVMCLEKSAVLLGTFDCLQQPDIIVVDEIRMGRFHCLHANRSTVWKSYTNNQSCHIPEHFYEMIEMFIMVRSEYVLPFAGHFRESSGNTIGMFRQSIQLYAPRKIQRLQFEETVYAFVVFFCAICYQLGGTVPDLKQFLFLYTYHHRGYAI
ncbi:uncharacterized protein TNCT_207821 [Trichonephila clavata]|uniref:Uncharacterized protein n=1 Tax=Trichonephila clavata TaxID=2740835 RepID=A0A8X6KQG9_TRICU|nr:uncharacterized protein TNCT_207821 [Trichonephila clavata]